MKQRHWQTFVFTGLAVCAVASVLFWVLEMDWGTPRCGPVEGVVTLDGKPLDTVEIVFLPDPVKGTKGARAACYTDAQGRFKLTSEKYGQEGALVGYHRVVIRDITSLPDPPGANRDHPNEGLEPTAQRGDGVKTALAQKQTAGSSTKKSRVPPEYEDANRTPFQNIEVTANGQTLNFDVVTKGKQW